MQCISMIRTKLCTTSSPVKYKSLEGSSVKVLTTQRERVNPDDRARRSTSVTTGIGSTQNDQTHDVGDKCMR